ncbi:MAG: SusD/RagB family nutrient-binding outer membrane lipoprotein [Filimonas sp.]|nr:SusD/RagB family nutrient-binding outer membrane lipoprotein [Filimonas sp.]
MKKIAYILLGATLLGGFSSCKKWLDVNTNPDTGSNTVASVDTRLSGMQHYFLYGYGTAGTRSALITGALTRSYAPANTHNQLAAWDPIIGSATTPYQYWFVGCAPNIQDLIDKATAEQAWYYVGAAKLLRAMGFMLMVDWYGEMPYTEALGNIPTPKYDQGKDIFNGCLKDLDDAIASLQKTQPATATPLAKGDGWNGGDVSKWIKLAYGLKARWLNNLSKKSALYKPDDILDALTKAAQSNAEGTIITHFNQANDNVGDVLLADPLLTSIAFDGIGLNNYFFPTKFYMDLLTNTFTGGSGVVDPRTDKLIPAAQYNISGTIQLKRSAPVDMITSDIRLKNGPIIPTYNATTHKWTVNTTDPNRMADSLFVNLQSYGAMKNRPSATDDDTYVADDGRIMSTGTFYTRGDAPTHLLGYPELCFIKAEVLFRKGDKGGALTAYQSGIRAHMELMNMKLATYKQGTANTSKNIIPAADITTFLQSAAVAQTAGDLTMAKIMQQKFIACSYSQNNWNDMRRFNFSAGNVGGFGVVYPDFDRPKEFSSSGATKLIGGSKADPRYWFRRICQPAIETQYNQANLKASNPEALLPSIWSVPVWWDIEE